jgi:hypothetical protein
MRRIFVPFRQSVIAFRLQLGLSICALIALGVVPCTAHPPSRRFGAAGSAVATTESDVFVAASLRRDVHGAIHPPNGTAPWLHRCTFIGSLLICSCLFVFIRGYPLGRFCRQLPKMMLL